MKRSSHAHADLGHGLVLASTSVQEQVEVRPICSLEGRTVAGRCTDASPAFFVVGASSSLSSSLYQQKKGQT